MNMKWVTIPIGIGLVLWAAPAYSGDSKVDQRIIKRFDSGTSRQDVIVRFENADLDEMGFSVDRSTQIRRVRDHLRDHSKSTQRQVLSWLKSRNRGVSHRERNFLTNSILVRDVDRAFLNELSDRQDIRWVEPNVRIKALMSDLPNQNTNQMNKMQAPKMWAEGFYGEGIVIGIIDTGVYGEHDALRRQYRGYPNNHDYNWIDVVPRHSEPLPEDAACMHQSPVPVDCHGHGTHVTGAAVGDDGGEYRVGTAPQAKWIACRGYDSNAYGTIFDHAKCAEWLLSPYPIRGDSYRDGDPSKAPHIVNLSSGCEPKGELACPGYLYHATKAFKQAGIIFVAAAGNSGPKCESVNTPAEYTDRAISVGNYDAINLIPSQDSSRGPSVFDGGLAPTVMAPGMQYKSAWIGTPDNYSKKSGTSVSSPLVAGLIALLFNAKPELIGDFDGVREILTNAKGKSASADCGDIAPGEIPNNVYGHGFVKIHKAYSEIDALH